MQPSNHTTTKTIFYLILLFCCGFRLWFISSSYSGVPAGYFFALRNSDDIIELFQFPLTRLLEPFLGGLIMSIWSSPWLYLFGNFLIALGAIIIAGSLLNKIFSLKETYIFLTVLCLLLIPDTSLSFDLSLAFSLFLVPLCLFKIDLEKRNIYYLILIPSILILPFYGEHKFITLPFPILFLFFLIVYKARSGKKKDGLFRWDLLQVVLAPLLIFVVTTAINSLVYSEGHAYRAEALKVISDPYDPQNLTLLSRRLIEGRDISLGERALNITSGEHGMNPEITYLRGILRTNQGRYREAGRYFNELVVTKRRESLGHTGLARLCRLEGLDEKAIFHFKEALADWKDDPELLYQLAISYIKLGDVESARAVIQDLPFDEIRQIKKIVEARIMILEGNEDIAISSLKKLLDERPGDRKIALVLAEALSLSGRNGEANMVLRDILMGEPKDLSALEMLFWIHYKEENLSRMSEIVDRIEPLQPGGLLKHKFKGYLQLSRGLFKEAEGEFNKGLNIAPGDLKLIRGLAIAAVGRKRYSSSLKLFERLSKSGRLDQDMLRQYLVASIKAKDHEAVDEILKRIKEVQPLGLSLKIMIARFFLDQGMIDEAGILIGEIEEVDPKSPTTIELRGDLNYKARNLDEAANFFKRLFDETRSTRVLFKLFTSYMDSGLDDKANALLEGFLVDKPRDFSRMIYTSMGEMAKNTGQLDLALNMFGKALDIDKNDVWARLFMGYVYLQQNDHEQALNIFDSLLFENPNNYHANLGKGLLLFLKGMKGEAKAYLIKAMEGVGGDVNLLIALGSIYYSEGKHQESLQLLKQALDLPLDDVNNEVKTLLFGNLALIYEQQGDEKGMKELEDMFGRLYPKIHLNWKVGIGKHDGRGTRDEGRKGETDRR